MSGPAPGRFADLDWQERWNNATAVAALSQSGPHVLAAGMFGVLRFRLDRPADVAAIVVSFRQFADMVAEAGRKFEAARHERYLTPGMTCTAYWYAQQATLLCGDSSDQEFLAALGRRADRLATWYGLRPSQVAEGPGMTVAWPEWVWSIAVDAMAQHAAEHGDYGDPGGGPV